MTNDVDQLNAERNSLHILPLITVPLSIPSLQKARIVKNPRLEGMVELYSGQDIGSGQIHPNELGKVFDFSGEKKRDLAIVKTLSKLSSYDVYSLRIELTTPDVLPLSIPSLQKARIVKNPRLEGMVELYSGQDIGSGQIHPNELGKVFDFSGEKKRDLAIVKTLSKLSSYDVYSLRIELRKLGINVEDHENLRLSSSMTSQLSDYTHVFLKPLIDAIYGDAAKNVGSYQEMVKLFMAPEQDVARNNLVELAKSLEIPITDFKNTCLQSAH